MSHIAIITDTDSSLPADVAAAYGIPQVPITVHFGDQTFATGVDINDKTLFERIDREGRLPTTSAPAPGAFVSAYHTAFEAGAESIICICVSSEVSATYGAAVAACNDFPGKKITVVDSRTLSMAQGFMALAAAEAVRGGATHDEAVARARSVGERAHLYATLSTLKYLAMSGRVGKVAAGMAKLLNIRPILTVKDGKLDMLEKVRTRSVALARLVDLVQNSVGGKPVEYAALIHVNDHADADEVEAQLRSRLALPERVYRAEFSAGLAVHAGNVVVGVVLITAE